MHPVSASSLLPPHQPSLNNRLAVDLLAHPEEAEEITVLRHRLWTTGGAWPCSQRSLFGQRGAVLVEAAFVVVLLLMLLIGIFWIGRAYNVSQTITRAAREGARFAALPTCATCGNAYPTNAQVQAVVDASLLASSLDPLQVTGFSITRGVVLNPGSNPQSTGVVVSLGYPYQFVLPFTSTHLTSVTLTAQVQMREE